MGLIRSARRGTNLDNAVNRLSSCWISFRFFGLLISVIAFHFSGLALIPLWVSMNPINLPPSTPNAQLSGLRRMLVLRRASKTSCKVLNVLATRVRFDNDIVHINLHAFSDHSLENLVHKPLIRCPNVLQAKRHYLIEVVCIVGHEGCFLLVPRVHVYLVVARKSIQETQYLVPCRSINEPVDVRQWVWVFRARLV